MGKGTSSKFSTAAKIQYLPLFRGQGKIYHEDVQESSSKHAETPILFLREVLTLQAMLLLLLKQQLRVRQIQNTWRLLSH